MAKRIGTEIQMDLSLDLIVNHVVVRKILPFLTVGLLVLCQYVVFLYVPTEQVMGEVQRIFYFHVGSAIATYVFIALLFMGSVLFLVQRRHEWSLLADAAVAVGFLFCSIVLVTGMIWGHSAWNTWWRWEPRLVSFLILWLLMCSYLLLQKFVVEDQKREVYAAVLGVLIAINVPIVIFSVRFLDHTQQLHPQVIANQGLRDIRFAYGLAFSTVTLVLLGSWLLLVAMGNMVLRKRLEELKRTVHFRKKVSSL